MVSQNRLLIELSIRSAVGALRCARRGETPGAKCAAFLLAQGSCEKILTAPPGSPRRRPSRSRSGVHGRRLARRLALPNFSQPCQGDKAPFMMVAPPPMKSGRSQRCCRSRQRYRSRSGQNAPGSFAECFTAGSLFAETEFSAVPFLDLSSRFSAG
jgi:hypothetical protein